MSENGVKLTGLGKCRAILLHVLLTRGDPSLLCAALCLTRDTRRRPYRACPITAQSGVEDHPVVLEELERIASAGGQERAGLPPTIRNRGRCGDIGRDALPVKKPDGYTRIVPKHCQGPKLVSRATPKARLGGGSELQKNSLAKTPPPLLLNAAPNELV